MANMNDDYHCTHNHKTDMHKKSKPMYVNKESVYGNDDGNDDDGNDDGNSSVSVNISKR